MAYLTNDSGPDAEKRLELGPSESVIGRHPDCHIVVNVGAVSRQHARILFQDSRFFLEDLKSRNGTFLNGKRIEGLAPIQHGDQIRVCDISFTFHQDDRPVERFRPRSGADGSTLATVLLDDEAQTTSSTIMSKLDVSSSRGRVQFTSSPEAKLAALLEITQSLGKALALDEVLPQVLNSLFKIFVQADRGFIGLKNNAGVLVPRWYKVRREEAEDTIRVSRTIVKQVMESQEAILSADAASDERFEMSQSIADFRIRSMMCAPLLDSEGAVDRGAADRHAGPAQAVPVQRFGGVGQRRLAGQHRHRQRPIARECTARSVRWSATCNWPTKCKRAFCRRAGRRWSTTSSSTITSRRTRWAATTSTISLCPMDGSP